MKLGFFFLIFSIHCLQSPVQSRLPETFYDDSEMPKTNPGGAGAGAGAGAVADAAPAALTEDYKDPDVVHVAATKIKFNQSQRSILGSVKSLRRAPLKKLTDKLDDTRSALKITGPSEGILKPMENGIATLFETSGGHFLRSTKNPDVVGFSKQESKTEESKTKQPKAKDSKQSKPQDSKQSVNLAIASSNNVTISSSPSGVTHITQNTGSFLPDSSKRNGLRNSEAESKADLPPIQFQYDLRDPDPRLNEKTPPRPVELATFPQQGSIRQNTIRTPRPSENDLYNRQVLSKYDVLEPTVDDQTRQDSKTETTIVKPSNRSPTANAKSNSDGEYYMNGEPISSRDQLLETPNGFTNKTVRNNAPYSEPRSGNNAPYSEPRSGNNAPYSEPRSGNNAPYSEPRSGNNAPYSEPRSGNLTPFLGPRKNGMSNDLFRIQSLLWDNPISSMLAWDNLEYFPEPNKYDRSEIVGKYNDKLERQGTKNTLEQNPDRNKTQSSFNESTLTERTEITETTPGKNNHGDRPNISISRPGNVEYVKGSGERPTSAKKIEYPIGDADKPDYRYSVPVNDAQNRSKYPRNYMLHNSGASLTNQKFSDDSKYRGGYNWSEDTDSAGQENKDALLDSDPKYYGIYEYQLLKTNDNGFDRSMDSYPQSSKLNSGSPKLQTSLRNGAAANPQSRYQNPDRKYSVSGNNIDTDVSDAHLDKPKASMNSGLRQREVEQKFVQSQMDKGSNPRIPQYSTEPYDEYGFLYSLFKGLPSIAIGDNRFFKQKTADEYKENINRNAKSEEEYQLNENAHNKTAYDFGNNERYINRNEINISNYVDAHQHGANRNESRPRPAHKLAGEKVSAQAAKNGSGAADESGGQLLRGYPIYFGPSSQEGISLASGIYLEYPKLRIGDIPSSQDKLKLDIPQLPALELPQLFCLPQLHLCTDLISKGDCQFGSHSSSSCPCCAILFPWIFKNPKVAPLFTSRSTVPDDSPEPQAEDEASLDEGGENYISALFGMPDDNRTNKNLVNTSDKCRSQLHLPSLRGVTCRSPEKSACESLIGYKNLYRLLNRNDSIKLIHRLGLFCAHGDLQGYGFWDPDNASTDETDINQYMSAYYQALDNPLETSNRLSRLLEDPDLLNRIASRLHTTPKSLHAFTRNASLFLKEKQDRLGLLDIGGGADAEDSEPTNDETVLSAFLAHILR